MGDSVAPDIKIVDTKFDGTSSVSVDFKPIPVNLSESQGLMANSALKVTLASLKMRNQGTPTQPTGMQSDNIAPVITFDGTTGISVAFEPIEAKVADVSSTSSVPFWKAATYKWTNTSVADSSPEPPETLSTSEYEKYFPSDIRNKAPVITMKKPAGDWDKTAYLTLASEFIPFRTELAASLNVKPPEDEEEVSFTGSAAVAKFFPEDRLNKAPEITIEPGVKVEFSCITVAEPTELAKTLLE